MNEFVIVQLSKHCFRSNGADVISFDSYMCQFKSTIYLRDLVLLNGHTNVFTVAVCGCDEPQIFLGGT